MWRQTCVCAFLIVFVCVFVYDDCVAIIFFLKNDWLIFRKWRPGGITVGLLAGPFYYCYCACDFDTLHPSQFASNNEDKVHLATEKYIFGPATSLMEMKKFGARRFPIIGGY